MDLFTLREAAQALGCNGDRYGSEEVGGVVIDSREAGEGSLFFAIKGDKFDGHDFVKGVLQKGALAAVCERVPEGAPEEKILLVEDTRRAFLALAGFYRAKFNIPVVGLTGSVGKTTTKEMIAAVLSQKYRTLATEGNLNNEIGLPKMCFRLDESYEAAVLEMGMSGFGEISRLTRTARPTIGVITNIGVSHIEKLGSQKGILKAKMEILEGMDPTAPLVINGDDSLLNAGVCGLTNPVLKFGIDCEDADCRAVDVIQTDEGMSFTIEYRGGAYKAELPAVGMHNVYNACAAFVCGMLAGVSPEEAVRGLAEYSPSGMRQRIVHKNGVTVIEDCYNASPDSVKASLNVLANCKCRRRIAVLGDMKELGEYSYTAHTSCGAFAAEKSADVLLACGPESAGYIEGANGRIPCALHFSQKSDLSAALCAIVRDGDAVLVKGSRAMKLEDVISDLYNALDEKT